MKTKSISILFLILGGILICAGIVGSLINTEEVSSQVPCVDGNGNTIEGVMCNEIKYKYGEITWSFFTMGVLIIFLGFFHHMLFQLETK